MDPPTSFFSSKHTEIIPDDIIFNILMKLPVKSLIRLMCICKNWNTFIKSQAFKLNYSFSRPQGYLFVHSFQDSPIPSQPCSISWDNSFTKFSTLQIPSPGPAGRIIVGSCNGLVCLTNSKQFGHELYLWNPSIRKHKILTTTNHPKTWNIVALGFDSKINDYKILRIAYVNFGSASQPPQAEIYLLGTGSWRSLGLPEDLMERLVTTVQSRFCEYIDGGFHWLAIFVNEKRICYFSILRFDVEEERFTELKFPNKYLNSMHGMKLSLVDFKGFLGLIVNAHPQDGKNICHICIMNNENSWTRQKVRFEEKKLYCGCIGDQLVLLEESKRVSLFDPKTRQERSLDIPKPASVHKFTQSLALL